MHGGKASCLCGYCSRVGERVSPGNHRGAWKDALFHKCYREEGIKGVRGSKENF